MLSIRFQRTGKKKAPQYRVVVTEKTRDPWGKHNEIVGHYNPRTKEAVLKEDRIQYWVSVGAQPTNSVRNLLIRLNVIKGEKVKSITISKKRQGALDAKNTEKMEALAAAEEAKKAEAEAKKAAAEAEKAAAEEAKAAAETAPVEEVPAEVASKVPEEEAPAEPVTE
ncbi:30S ribosomal protein S16 [Candidatus Uhrbacteria bacterium CG10_big_fil_rev_8_21_14_0_10_50_16]|uniref:Small ribosomal subunit protein bS16 n=1 Tax=Candidatus Uhrbacteria bacterium CG10_big_fil_rev_8_21_14_0_10_50_16 TaxID=1975039 RepID=A0A2H0RME9_9BACT|nr:MAG: 30S ribosomal protein S16 [Candidatus Uhrbacteria bacterium CG10_big_fil_rev_8_21_14_0_10_50_16]